MTLFTCPICAAPLERQEGRYLCPNRHSYDRSREGYVHLLPANMKHSKDPGDDKAMAAARTKFLDGGWYAHLRQALIDLALAHLPKGGALLDAGCGEGYYTAAIAQALEEAGREVRIAGVDLSKHALKKAAKRVKTAEFAVGSVYHLPLADTSADMVLDCFSPLAIDEFHRVLKKDGVFCYVVPAAAHLYEMKEVLYDAPYRNAEEDVPYEGFASLGVIDVSREVMLPDSETIMALFGMTPYAWKTPREGVERLREKTELTVTAAFRIHVFRKV